MDEIPFSKVADTPTIDQSGRLHLSKQVLDALGWKVGDKVAVIPRPDEGKVEILKPRKVLAALTAMTVLLLSTFSVMPDVYAQQDDTVNMDDSVQVEVTTTQGDNSTSTTSTTDQDNNNNFGEGGQISVAGGDMLELSLAGSAAHLPFRVEITYPSGIADIWNVTRNSPSSVYLVTDSVGGLSVGTTTKTFSTGTPDTFTIHVGQRYPQPVTQDALVTMYSNNTQVMPQTKIPINADHFEFMITFTTTVPPHTPTAEELNAGVYNRLDQLQADFNIHGDETHQTNRHFNLAASGFEMSILPNVMMVVINLFVLMTAIMVLRSMRKSSHPVITIGSGKSKDGQGSARSTTPKDPPPPEQPKEPVRPVSDSRPEATGIFKSLYDMEQTDKKGADQ